MSVTDELLANNARYAETFSGPLPLPPAKHVAVVACMDARLNVYGILGLNEGEAHVIRNAGGVVTEDEIRSLAISQRLLGTKEIILIHHTDCGMLTFTDDEFKQSHPGRDRPQAAVGRRGVHRPRHRRPAVDQPDQGQPVHPAHRPGARLRVRRGHREAERGRLSHGAPAARGAPLARLSPCGSEIGAGRAGARLVPGARPRPAVAPPGHHAVGRAGQRVHAAADAGRAGRAGLAALDGRSGRRPSALAAASPGRRAAGLGQARLPAPRPAPARGRRRDRASGTATSFRPRWTSWRRCPGWAATRRVRSPRSATGGGRRWWTPTSAGWWPAPCTARATPDRPGSRADLADVDALLPAADAPRGGGVGRADGAGRGGLHGPGAALRRAARCTRCAPGRRPGGRAYTGPRKPVQGFAGTDRQVRGRLLDVLRDAPGPVPRAALDAAWSDAAQRDRCLHSLLVDGLAEQHDDGRFALPA